MKKAHLKLFLLFFALALIWSCGQSSETKGDMPPQEIVKAEKAETDSASARIAIDVGIVVSNMEKSLVFYQDLIGLPFITEINTRLIGVGRMVQLRHGRSIIKLVEMEKKPSLKKPKEISSAFGYRYITLMITDMHDIVNKVEEGKVPVKIPVTELVNGAKIFMVEDPDGNIVEFVQEAID